MPWVPPGQTVVLPGRGEMFVRRHQHPDPAAPTLLLLHGWTASADLQFFTAYQALAAHYSFVAIDHRGHGRGLRSAQPFSLEEVADDAAATVRALGIDRVVTVGYSMGGPISMHLAHRHPGLVSGLVVQATALEWKSTWTERLRWRAVRLLGPIIRSWVYPRWLHFGMARVLEADHSLLPYVAWIEAEVCRGDARSIVQAGHALSRHDARPWATRLGVPAASLITTADRLVLPGKQRALATALSAYVIELHGDHVSMWQHPEQFSDATLALVDHVTGRTGAQPGARSGDQAS